MQSEKFGIDHVDYNPVTPGWTFWHQVNSSNVAALRYNFEGKQLQVVFVNGNRYEYSDVEFRTFENFLASESKGKFLDAAIKKFGYGYRRI